MYKKLALGFSVGYVFHYEKEFFSHYLDQLFPKINLPWSNFPECEILPNIAAISAFWQGTQHLQKCTQLRFHFKNMHTLVSSKTNAFLNVFKVASLLDTFTL